MQAPDASEAYTAVPAYPRKSAAKHGTAITVEMLKKIADAHTTFPEGFTVHPKVMPQLQRRAAAITRGRTGPPARSWHWARCWPKAGPFG